MLSESNAKVRGSGSVRERSTTSPKRSRLWHALKIEWWGQTLASLCWIASVFSYGISSAGDWLQLFAATAWLIANIASLVTSETD